MSMESKYDLHGPELEVESYPEHVCGKLWSYGRAGDYIVYRYGLTSKMLENWLYFEHDVLGDEQGGNVYFDPDTLSVYDYDGFYDLPADVLAWLEQHKFNTEEL